MIDQANDLRKLVMQAAEQPQDSPSRSVRTALVAGGKGGVGTTTVAVNLAVAAAQQARPQFSSTPTPTGRTCSPSAGCDNATPSPMCFKGAVPSVKPFSPVLAEL